LQVIGCQRRAETAPAIKDKLSLQIGILSLNVALDNTLAQVHCSGQMVSVELTVFADVDQNDFFAAIEPGLDFVNIRFPDTPFGIFDNLQKARWVLVSHGRRPPPKCSVSSMIAGEIAK
jgi:hypothetical protein